MPWGAHRSAVDVMSELAHHLYTEACNNAWSNHRLLKACCALTRAEFIAPRVSFFPTIKATLNHIVTVDWYYVDALERAFSGKDVNADAARFFDPVEPFDDCAPLAIAQHEVDQRLIALCKDATDAQLVGSVAIQRRKVEHDTGVRLLAHLFQHQIHHRGQVHAMLSGTSVAPPQLDEFFCTNEADLRAAELAELGLSEQQIWRR